MELRSITAGFSLIAIEAYKLAATLEGTYEHFSASSGLVGIGWGNFQQYWALDFFSSLMAACFLIVLGIILGLKVRNKLGYVTIAGGVAIMLVGVSILAANLATSLNYYPPNYYFSLQVAWNTTISFFLIIGALLVVVGTVYLIKVRNRNRRNQEDKGARMLVPKLS
jgi:heme/copper-type cytochrome/quinol oxidase subunit 2